MHLILFYHWKEHYLFFIFKLIFKCSFGLIILYLLCILKDRSWFNNGLSGEYLLFYICTLFLLLFNLCLVVIHLYLQIFFIFTLIFLFILFRLKAFLKETIVLIKALLIFFFLRLKLKRKKYLNLYFEKILN